VNVVLDTLGSDLAYYTSGYGVAVGPAQALTGLNFGNYQPVDFGDAAGYADARHAYDPRFYLGVGTPDESISYELTPKTDLRAEADTEDDGIVFVVPRQEPYSLRTLIPGQTAEFLVNVTDLTGSNKYLHAWIDLNGDGSFAGYVDGEGNFQTEQILTDWELTDGENTVTTPNPLPADLANLTTIARFRLSHETGLTAEGPAPGTFWDLVPDGEVEDYLVEIGVGTCSISGSKFFDANQDGLWNGAEVPLRGFLVYADSPYDDGVYTRGVGKFDYVDRNGNDVFDPTRDVALEPYDITDHFGNYHISGLYAGAYTFREDLFYGGADADGWVQTYPTGDGSYPLSLNIGDQVSGINFGNYLTPQIRVDGVAVAEGNSGETQVTVNVHRSHSFGSQITLNLETGNGTASANSDYQPVDTTIFLPPQVPPAATWTTQTLPNSSGSSSYDYRASGQLLVWETNDGDDWDVYVYDHGTGEVRNVSDRDYSQGVAEDNGRHDRYPAVGGERYVAWSGIPDGESDYEVFLYDTRFDEVLRLTYDNVDNLDVQVSDLSVAWTATDGSDREIYLYDIEKDVDDHLENTGQTIRLTDNTLQDQGPLLAGSSTGSLVVWTSVVGTSNNSREIWIYEGGVPRRLTTNAVEDRNPQISDYAVVYEEWDGNDYELFVYEFGTTDPVQLTDNSVDDTFASISRDDIVWQASDGFDIEIYYYNLERGGQPTNLSSNSWLDERPSVNDGRVSWHSFVGGNWENYYRVIGPDATRTNISNYSQNDWYPAVSDSFVAWRSYQGGTYQIVVANRNEPEVVTPYTLVIYGDTTVEPDEEFYLNLSSPDGDLFPEGRDSNGDPDPSSLQVPIGVWNDDGSLDYGDAPAPYPTLLKDNGARHVISGTYLGQGLSGWFLGARVDADTNGRPSVAADGDDTLTSDDEDGVTFLTPLVSGTTGQIQVAMQVPQDKKGVLHAWFDFNADGDWDDGGEHFTWEWDTLGSGTITRGVTVPADAKTGATYARFRFAEDTPENRNLSYTGTAMTGEVEDYRVTIASGANRAPTGLTISNGTVDENVDTTAGHVVGVLTGTDPDAVAPWNELSYTITGGADQDVFSIDDLNKLVLDDGWLDYETMGPYEVEVTVADGGTPNLTFVQTLSILINDLNEAPIVALQNTTTLLPEGSDTSSRIHVADIVVTDDALGTNALILAGADAARFEIDPASGAGGFMAGLYLKAGEVLDYEAQTQLDVTVQVNDADLAPDPNDAAVLSIGVTDVEETAVGPVSDSNEATNTVAEDAAIGATVGLTALAIDADPFDTVSYSLTNNAGGLFAIDAATGVVTVAGALDAETAMSHTITVLATSSDSSVSTADFTIAVMDVNEAGVGLVSDANLAANTVAEDAAIGDTVGITAAATDSDGGDTVSYALADNAGGRFAIDPSTGVVTVAGALDFETA
ncbi:MAG: hypothetical protein GXY83_44530, partial [Rhodopirellula sp.]|nr:hypothetical protein [Rhodopirellula sp.]